MPQLPSRPAAGSYQQPVLEKEDKTMRCPKCGSPFVDVFYRGGALVAECQACGTVTVPSPALALRAKPSAGFGRFDPTPQGFLRERSHVRPLAPGQEDKGEFPVSTLSAARAPNPQGSRRAGAGAFARPGARGRTINWQKRGDTGARNHS